MQAADYAYDLAVIGAGPAGASAAWAAARAGLRVALLERGEYPRDKVCGEFVSPQALAALERMAPGLAGGAPAIVTAKFFATAGAGREFRLPRPARGISRLRLDAALWEAAGEAGAVRFARSAVAGVAATGGQAGYRLEIAGWDRSLAARHVIVAAGRWWSLPGLRAAAPPARPAARGASRWIGVKARFRRLALPSTVEMYCFRGGYCGLAPVENGWGNACCLIDARRLAGGGAGLRETADFGGWIAKAACHPALSARLRAGEQATATVITAPVLLGPQTLALESVLIAGDAAGFIDPFAGDGIARALLEGQLAAAALCETAREPARRYSAALATAAGWSFPLAALLRQVVLAPACLQSAALWALARNPVGPALVRATRFR